MIYHCVVPHHRDFVQLAIRCTGGNKSARSLYFGNISNIYTVVVIGSFCLELVWCCLPFCLLYNLSRPDLDEPGA